MVHLAKETAIGLGMRALKRVLVTFLAFLVGGVFIAVWREIVPPSGLTGAVMGIISIGIVFGVWKWSSRFK